MKLFSSTTLLVGANANFLNVFDSLKGNSLKDMDMTKFLLMQMQQTQYKADPANAASTRKLTPMIGWIPRNFKIFIFEWEPQKL